MSKRLLELPNDLSSPVRSITAVVAAGREGSVAVGVMRLEEVVLVGKSVECTLLDVGCTLVDGMARVDLVVA